MLLLLEAFRLPIGGAPKKHICCHVQLALLKSNGRVGYMLLMNNDMNVLLISATVECKKYQLNQCCRLVMLALISSQNCWSTLGIFASNSDVRNEDGMLACKYMDCCDNNRLMFAFRDNHSFAVYGANCIVLLWLGGNCCSCCISNRLLAAGRKCSLA